MMAARSPVRRGPRSTRKSPSLLYHALFRLVVPSLLVLRAAPLGSAPAAPLRSLHPRQELDAAKAKILGRGPARPRAAGEPESGQKHGGRDVTLLGVMPRETTRQASAPLHQLPFSPTWASKIISNPPHLKLPYFEYFEYFDDSN